MLKIPLSLSQILRMPRYTYYCEKCDEYFDISHGMTETLDLKCECDALLVKVLSVPLSLDTKKISVKVGDTVKSSIEEFKKDLQRQRRDASGKEI